MKKIIDQLNIDQWVNGDPNYLNELQGQPVLLHFFQMLCPACVVQSLPLMQALWDRRSQHGIKILVIHSVFEHHEHMNALALKAFLSEFRYTFPVAIDAAGAGRLPQTMAKLGIQGTPSSLVINRDGHESWRHFGRLEGLDYGLLVGAHGARPAANHQTTPGCNDQGCLATEQGA